MRHDAHHSIVLLSGGMDSAVLLADMLNRGHTVDALAVDYGQRHRRELTSAATMAAHYQVRFDVLDLTPVGKLLTGSALTDPAIEVPHGHYAAPSMAATIVPNRNAILLMIAVGVAAARKASYVATAVHAGDHPVYPDCRPAFIDAADHTARLATAGHGDVHVIAPFASRTKTDIAILGDTLHVPFALTWSCYEGGDAHCGRCGTCTERREAFNQARIADPTRYATTPGEKATV